MFDLRYHVASLAAVFLALIIGILVGVGIASQTSVEESERLVLEQRIADLQRKVTDLSADADLLRRQQEAGRRYIDESYPAVMNGRLRGVQVALLFIGHADSQDPGGLQSQVTQTIDDASGPGLTRMRALQIPIDAQELAAALGPDRDGLSPDEVGRRLARELVGGGETPTWDALAPVIVEEDQGSQAKEADAVVVAHTARIDKRPTARFVSGIYGGLAASGVPVVGIERLNVRPSRIAVYRRGGISSVDSVDTELGRISLAVLLAGGAEGHYGLKSTADEVVPPIEPLSLAPVPGG